jgi:UDP-N-acetylglucosamine--N-acetylmuramyl-(pentapeptide) pyrophosphoryl-undecaprenol N-acetylglucosamine transferase
LIPYPAATDDHQFYNALAFADSGAAKNFPQTGAPEKFSKTILELLRSKSERDAMQNALHKWHSPEAASDIAERILAVAVANLHSKPALENQKKANEDLSPRQSQIKSEEIHA